MDKVGFALGWREGMSGLEMKNVLNLLYIGKTVFISEKHNLMGVI